MIVKVRPSFIFGHVDYTNAFYNSIIGTPVVDDKRERIGTIVGYDKDTDQIDLDLDDCYKEQLMQNTTCSMEIQNG